MIYVATHKWYDLVIAMLKNHNVEFELEEVSAGWTLWEHYQARYKFASLDGRYVYLVEFNDPRQETLFRLKYSENI